MIEEKNKIQKITRLGSFSHRLGLHGHASCLWMLAQHPFIVPIPGTTKISRLIENTNSADIELSKEELSKLNEALSHIEIKDVYLGALVK